MPTHWDVTFFGSRSSKRNLKGGAIDLESLYRLFVHYLLLLLWSLSLLLLFAVAVAAVVVAVCK